MNRTCTSFQHPQYTYRPVERVFLITFNILNIPFVRSSSMHTWEHAQAESDKENSWKGIEGFIIFCWTNLWCNTLILVHIHHLEIKLRVETLSIIFNITNLKCMYRNDWLSKLNLPLFLMEITSGWWKKKFENLCSRSSTCSHMARSYSSHTVIMGSLVLNLITKPWSKIHQIFHL